MYHTCRGASFMYAQHAVHEAYTNDVECVLHMLHARGRYHLTESVYKQRKKAANLPTDGEGFLFL